jgi:hypothetical protein
MRDSSITKTNRTPNLNPRDITIIANHMPQSTQTMSAHNTASPDAVQAS